MQYSSILAGPYDMVICILKQHNSPPISHSDNTLMFSPPVLHGDSLSQAPRLLAHQIRANITLVWPSNMGQGRCIMCSTGGLTVTLIDHVVRLTGYEPRLAR